MRMTMMISLMFGCLMFSANSFAEGELNKIIEKKEQNQSTEKKKRRKKSKSAKKALGRGYQVEDLELLSSLGGASGYISVLVLALYINSPDIKSLYTNPVLMWPACLVMLYWVSRVWIIAHRGNMNDDPIVFALKDRASLVCGVLIGIFMMLAV